MKKLTICLISLLCCFFLCSCDSKDNSSTQAAGDIEMTEEGIFEGVVSGEDIDLEDTTLAYTDFFVDEKLALEIGDAVLKHLLGDELNDTTLSAKEIADRDFYVVTRFPKEIIPGNDYCVAINKKDGKILKIWMGE